MRKYDDEFKQNAVKKILDGQSVAPPARELGVGANLLHKWKKTRIETGSDVEKENIELKKKLREVEMERDILSGSLRATSAGEVKPLSVH